MKRERVGSDRSLCDIVCPEDIHDLERYCREEHVIINHCYGYRRQDVNCPETCRYARRLNRATN